MSIEEAVGLVIDSVALSRGGEVFVTKMPVIRIQDLAEVMISALAPNCGFKPDQIEIVRIGSKPGEKLYEELMSHEETRRAVELPRYFSILPAFRVAQMGLGYDTEADRIVLIVSELLPETAQTEPRVVRLTAARELMRALVDHIRQVVAGGRPICGNCGRPIDRDGHFCPKSNGHGRKANWA